MTLPEAMKIASDNAHGIAHNYFDVYLPAILMVNEAFPITGYTQREEDDTYYEADDLRQWNAEQDRRRAELRG